jgi:hypothetical protein
MLNCILFCVLLGGIGGCYVWLGAKKKDRADQILSVHREIGLIEKQIRERDLQINHLLAPESLRVSAMRSGLNLKPIDIGPRGRLVRLPEPSASPRGPQDNPVFAGNR